jgi:plasmid stabilization system protein ParE
MTYTLQFLPEVEEDLIGSYVWYEAKSAGIGEDLLRMFYAGASEILHNPMLCQKVYSAFRRRLLRRFPYAIYFTIEGDQVTVVGVFHCARDPRAIKAELRDR